MTRLMKSFSKQIRRLINTRSDVAVERSEARRRAMGPAVGVGSALQARLTKIIVIV